MRSRKCELDFNPRSPCGERPGQGRIPRPVLSISIHAPRVGSDVLDLSSSHTTSLFQSTLPVWGATWCWLLQWPYPLISIHAPRVGSDHKQRVGEVLIPKISIHAPRVGSDPADCGAYKQDNHFNPRSPCGERPRWALLRVSLRIFQSTLPGWGATRLVTQVGPNLLFQSTLPVWGATLLASIAL